MRYFYSHLIEIESVLVKLDRLDLKQDHKKHLAALVDSHLHHTVLDVILSQLDVEDKVIFLQKLKDDPQDPKLLEFLNQKVDKIEDKIKAAAKKLSDELHKDIKKSRTVK